MHHEDLRHLAFGTQRLSAIGGRRHAAGQIFPQQVVLSVALRTVRHSSVSAKSFAKLLRIHGVSISVAFIAYLNVTPTTQVQKDASNTQAVSEIE